MFCDEFSIGKYRIWKQKGKFYRTDVIWNVIDYRSRPISKCLFNKIQLESTHF